MKLRKFKSNEHGAVVVLVALSLTALFGFTALAVDFGMMASNKQGMQNACDAAALAAAADLAAGSSYVQNTAFTYTALNGFDQTEDTIDVDVLVSGKTVKVTIKEEMSMGFSAVLTGVRTRPVSASATAESTSIFGTCPYALFAGERIEEDGEGIVVTGNDTYIDGNIHSNSKIDMKHAEFSPGSVATAVGTVDLKDDDAGEANSIALDMPSFPSFEAAMSRMPGYVRLTGDYVIKKNDFSFQDLVDEAYDRFIAEGGDASSLLTEGLCIHIAGNIRSNGNDSSVYTAPYPIILVVDGDIDLNGTILASSGDTPMYLMTKTGDITVNGGGTGFTGIIFAPEGDVTINGNGGSITGSVVAQNIRKSGGKINVTYQEDVDRYLPDGKVHLIA